MSLLEVSAYRTRFWPQGLPSPLRGLEIAVLGIGFSIKW